MMIRSDWDLIQACRQGEELAWQQVVSQYQRLVFSIPLNYGLSHQDAADIVQLTFVMLMQGLDGLHQASHLGGWLATVARRNTWHVIERRGRENIDLTPITEQTSLHDQTATDEKEQWEANTWLYDGLTKLDETCRALLIALYLDLEQPAYSDVATRLGLAVRSISPMRARCLHRLRNIMRE